MLINAATLVLFGFLITGGTSSADESAMTNDDVLALVNAGLSDPLVVAKVEQAEVVAFDLSTETLISLKNAGVAEDVLAAMLDRSSTATVEPEAQAPLASTPPMQLPGTEEITVRLMADEGATELPMVPGSLSRNGFAGFGFTWLNIPGTAARVRIGDRRPRLQVRTPFPPDKRVFLVVLDEDRDDNMRSLKIGSFKQRLRFKSQAMARPDQDRVLPYSSEETQAGIWELAPEVDLEPGEYGIFVDFQARTLASGSIFPFGVD